MAITVEVTEASKPRDGEGNLIGHQVNDNPFAGLEKFHGEDGKPSLEKLAKGYQELQKKLGGSKGDEAEEQSTKEAPADPEGLEVPVETDDKPSPDTDAPIDPKDFDKYAEEFSEKGELTEESYKEIEKKYKLPRALVDNYIDGQLAKLELATNKYEASMLELAGGKQAYNELRNWIAQNYDDEAKTKFNEAVNSLDPEKGSLAIEKALLAREKGSGSDPKARYTGAAPSSGVVPFRDFAEYRAAITDPRYIADPSFRDSISSRVAKHGIPGIQVLTKTN